MIACLGAAWQPPSALAQSDSPDEDTQLWVYAIAQVPLGEETRLTLDATQRWREDRRGDEQQTYRFNIDHTVGDGVRLGGGFGVFETEGGSTELRPHQQLSVGLGRIALRTRIEQRFFDGADRMEVRIRQRVRYTHRLGEDWSASGDVEFFTLLQTRQRNPLATRDEWRGKISLSHRLGEGTDVGAAYMVIYSPRPAAIDRVSHVPQIVLTRRF